MIQVRVWCEVCRCVGWRMGVALHECEYVHVHVHVRMRMRGLCSVRRLSLPSPFPPPHPYNHPCSHPTRTHSHVFAHAPTDLTFILAPVCTSHPTSRMDTHS